MAEKPSLKQILALYYALRAQGVQRFPRPLVAASSTGSESASGMNSEAVGSGSGGVQSEMKTRCLFLIDFNARASHGSASAAATVIPPLLKRLLDRLSWRDFVDLHAVFDAPPKSPQLHPLDEKAVGALMHALTREQVGRCVCFGWRAAQACAVALGIPFALPPEAFEPIIAQGEVGKSIELLILPDVRELEAFPEWRSKVWESLQAFGPPR